MNEKAVLRNCVTYPNHTYDVLHNFVECSSVDRTLDQICAIFDSRHDIWHGKKYACLNVRKEIYGETAPIVIYADNDAPVDKCSRSNAVM